MQLNMTKSNTETECLPISYVPSVPRIQSFLLPTRSVTGKNIAMVIPVKLKCLRYINVVTNVLKLDRPCAGSENAHKLANVNGRAMVSGCKGYKWLHEVTV